MGGQKIMARPVLVVDDDDAIRKMVALVLQEEGYVVDCPRGREEARRHHAAGYLAKPFDLNELLEAVARFTPAA
jgi:DNA-binding response OmpR family regulator